MLSLKSHFDDYADDRGYLPLRIQLKRRSPKDIYIRKSELKCIQLSFTGASRDQIANEVGLSLNTVATHVKAVNKRIGFHSRTHTLPKTLRVILDQYPDIIEPGEDLDLNEFRDIVEYELTDRQKQILKCISEGLSRPEIEKKLEIQQGTVTRHFRAILPKFDPILGGVNRKTNALVVLMHMRKRQFERRALKNKSHPDCYKLIGRDDLSGPSAQAS